MKFVIIQIIIFFKIHLFFHISSLNRKNGYKRNIFLNRIRKKIFYNFIIENNILSNKNKYNRNNIKFNRSNVLKENTNNIQNINNNILDNEKKLYISKLLHKKKLFDYKFYSPAKINIFLRLKEKKKNYNMLSTLIHSINLVDDIFITILNEHNQKKLKNILYPCLSGDFLTIEKEDQNNINHINTNNLCTNNYIQKDEFNYMNYPLNDNNIIIKIIKKFRKKYNINNVKFLIHIKKRIPILSGLGGGSSNGSTIYYFLKNYYKNLNFLHDINNVNNTNNINDINNDTILKEIGSDLCFFNSTGLAYCTDYGSDFIDLKDCNSNLFEKEICIFKIDKGLSTKEVYENVDYKNIIQFNPILLLKYLLEPNEKIMNIIKEKEKNYLNNFVNIKNKYIENLFINDLEKPAFLLNNKLKEIKEILKNQNIFHIILMTGSGTSIYGLSKNNLYSNEEKKNIKNIINDIKCKLNVEINIHFCRFLRKKENSWYNINDTKI